MITNVSNIYISCHSKPHLLDKPKMLSCARARRAINDLLGVHSFLMYPWFDAHTSVNTVLISSGSLSSSNQSPKIFVIMSVKRVYHRDNIKFYVYLLSGLYFWLIFATNFLFDIIRNILNVTTHVVVSNTYTLHTPETHTHKRESYNGRNRQNINHIKPTATS